MKGIILAGGTGSRLWPITQGVSKQLLPVYDKPMIYYPLSTLMLAGIRQVLIISTPADLPGFERLLGDGSELGMEICYKEQPSPDGLAQAFILGKDYIEGGSVCLVLGDNIFYGQGFTAMMLEAVRQVEQHDNASIFAYPVEHPERYGVLTIADDGTPAAIVEKPKKPESDKAVVGLYYFPADVVQVASSIKPSARGELEITSVIEHYLKQNRLHYQCLGRGFAWLDTGTVDSLNDASNFIMAIQKRQGLKVAAIEEVAYRRGFISAKHLSKLAERLIMTDYGKYLKRLADGEIQ